MRAMEASGGCSSGEVAGPSGVSPVHLQNEGHCAVCDAPTTFIAHEAWLRDHYRCRLCGSIPRERALMTVIERRFPAWRELTMHESSPGLPSSQRLQRDCRSYIATHYFPDIAPGAIHAGFRNEDLAHQTFPDASFDLVISQDVMEHVIEPRETFREIARTLRPGGAHVFTTPIYPALTRSEVRARLRDGRVERLADAEYHGNPIDADGSLVTVHWGSDIGEIVQESSGLFTTVYTTVDRRLGLDGEFLEVMVCLKAQERTGTEDGAVV